MPNRWIVQVFSHAILGLVVPQARPVGGKFRTAAVLPQQLRDYLNLPADREQNAIMGDVADLAALDAVALDECLVGRTGRGSQRVITVQLPVLPEDRKPARIPKHVPAVRSLADLCDYFDAAEPRQLPRRVYKDTECGASISVQLATGEWLHGDDLTIQQTPRDTPIKAFTIQTIVEGCDAEVNSEPFVLPVRLKDITSWVIEMEARADELWHEANPMWTDEHGKPADERE